MSSSCTAGSHMSEAKEWEVAELNLTPEMRSIIGPSRNPAEWRVRTILKRFSTIVAWSFPEFSDNEWCAICDISNPIVGETWEILQLELAVEDCAQEVGPKWNVDAASLARRIATLDVGQKMAIAEFVERFWESISLQEAGKTHGEMISSIKQELCSREKKWT